MRRSEFKRKKPLLPKGFAQPSSELRRTELRRDDTKGLGSGKTRTGLSSRRAPLAPRSLKRAGEEQKYRKLRREFLADREWCEFPGGCVLRATEIQHRRGRNGRRLLQVEWWAASCHAHNMWAEEHTGEALAIGWLVRVNGTAA